MKKLFGQIIFFGFVGFATLLIDVLVTYTLFHFAGFSAFLASGVGFLSGFFFNFPMNRKKVFNHSESDRFSLHKQIVLYGILSIFNLFATSALVDLLVQFKIFDIQYAKIVVTAVFAVWNFIVFKLFIFSKKLRNEKSSSKKG